MLLDVKLLYLLLLLVCINACGGGGSGDSDGGRDVDSTSNALNPNLTGKIFQGCDGSYCTLNAKTGVYTVIPNTNYESQTNKFPYAAMTDFRGTVVEHDSSGFLVLADNRHGSTIFMQDYDGNYLWELTSNQELLSGKLSQDKQYIAIFTGNGSVSSTPTLKIYGVTGDYINGKTLEKNQIIWLRDNRLLYSIGRTFYFTKPASTETDYTLTLPADPNSVVSSGSIGVKAISPNESQIVFTVAEVSGSFNTAARNSRLYIMNLSGSDIRLLATTYNDDDPSIIAPSWSPDGRWILATEGYSPSRVRYGDDLLGTTYLVPADDPGKIYNLSENANERSPEVMLFRRYDYETNGITSKGTGATFPWVP
ncbi:MAG: hypothetical protein JAZ17_15620 [Candidatus Thiodiazotropha endolucinida]|nr:hypothetical protein [Candidatus Thiodiazotropha endolucinida]